ncbi:MAG: hypothetical protein U0361_07880 [Nitrospiraceae bacterium]
MTKMKADVQVAERELKALTDDEKSDLGAIEAKLKQSGTPALALRMVSIKTRREALGVLTADQRAKEKVEHEKAAAAQEHGQGCSAGQQPPWQLRRKPARRQPPRAGGPQQ